jgi:hypothetical protein
MEEEDVYSKDGTVDYLGNPANRKKTGTWKACPFILGNCGVSTGISTFIESVWIDLFEFIYSIWYMSLFGLTYF